MDLSTQDKTKIIFGGLFVIILLVGIIVGTMLTQSKQGYNLKSQASSSSPIEVLTPKPGENVTASVEVNAVAKIKDSGQKINGVATVDGQSPKLIKVNRTDSETLVLTVNLDLSGVSGNRTIELQLHQLINDKPSLIASTTVPVVIVPK